MNKNVKRSRRHPKRSIVAMIALMLVLLVSTGVTSAFLIDRTEAVTNVFEAGKTNIEIDETFDKETKTNVSIKNNGTVPVYIRVALVPTWEDESGNAVAVAASLEDLKITWSNSINWIHAADGFWYYIVPVNAEASTETLISKATVVTQNDYQMNLQVMAQSIQSEPDAAVLDAWESGVSGVSTNNELTIKTN